MAKKTHEEFVEDIRRLHGDDYEILSPYNGTKSVVEVRHKTCGHVFKRLAGHLREGRLCVNCKENSKKRKTTEEYKKQVKDIVGDEYLVEGEYVSSAKKILMKHQVCGKTFPVTPHNFLVNDSRCPFCSSKRAKTTDEFKKEMFDLVGDEYELTTEYINAKTKVEILHKKCNRSYSVNPSVFLSGRTCPHCKKEEKAQVERIKKDKEFKKEVLRLVGEEYTVIGEYVKSSVKIKMKHSGGCGKEYEVTPNDFKRGCRCPYCSLKGGTGKKITTDEFKKIISDLVGDEYTVLGEYTRSREKIEIKHNKCGKILKIAPSRFWTGTRCDCDK